MSWLVAVTWPHYECRVERMLNQFGFDHYLPRCKSKTQRTVLLFPRYVFVGPFEKWPELRKIYGVSRLLKAGGDFPAPLEDSAVKALQARENLEGLIELPQHHVARLRVGQKVRITIGALAGFKGTYRGKTTKRWERVELASFGQVVVPYGNLVAAEG